ETDQDGFGQCACGDIDLNFDGDGVDADKRVGIKLGQHACLSKEVRGILAARIQRRKLVEGLWSEWIYQLKPWESAQTDEVLRVNGRNARVDGDGNDQSVPKCQGMALEKLFS